MEHTHEDVTDYRSMAIFFQGRIGDIQKGHEADLFFLNKKIAELEAQVSTLTQELESNVSENQENVSATDE